MSEMENERGEVNDKPQTVVTSEQIKHTRKPGRRNVGLVEVAIIAAVIVVVWGLFSLPTVFFIMSNETTSVTQNFSNQSNETVTPNSQFSYQPATLNITCSTNFYLDTDAGYCRPACGQWKPFSDDVVTVNAVIVIMASVVSIVGGILIVAISILKNKQMFKFPSILVLYQSTNVSLYMFVVLIGYMDTQTFLCPSRDAAESFSTTTPYCTLYGLSLYYFVSQAAMFWAAHIASLLLLITFPLKAKLLETSGHFKKIHILIVVAALVLPFGLVAAPLGTGGFRPFYYPFPCRPQKNSVSLVLPLSILSAIGVSLLVLLFWVLIRRKWKNTFKTLSKKSIRKHGTQRADPRNSTVTVQTTAVIKVLLSFICYTPVTVLGVVSLASLNEQLLYSEVAKYFICESSGVSSKKVCEKTYETLLTPLPTTMSLFFLGVLWPITNLLYVMNLKKIYFSIKHKILCSDV